jgi:hypothetical protein
MLANDTAVMTGGNHKLTEMAQTRQADTGTVLQSIASSCYVSIYTTLHNLQLLPRLLRLNHPVEHSPNSLLTRFLLVKFHYMVNLTSSVV